jgi:hypothetical protein
MVLGLAVAVATGGKAFDYQLVTAGPVLYLALEDSPIRLQSRLEDLIGDGDAPEDLHIWTEVERGRPGVDAIEGWLDEHPTARMVIVDVLAKFRARTKGDDRYQADYDAMSDLKGVADRQGVAVAVVVVVVHHTRKSAGTAEDFLEEVSGTNGIAGACDTIAVLRRGRAENDATLAVTGRDILEAEHTLTLTGCHWRMIGGPDAILRLAPTRQAIFAALRSLGKSSRPVDVAKRVDSSRDTVRKTMQRMADADQIMTDGHGRYWVPAELGHVWDSATGANSAGQSISGTDGTPGTPPVTDADGTPADNPSTQNVSHLSQQASDLHKQASGGVSQGCPSCPSTDPTTARALHLLKTELGAAVLEPTGTDDPR